MLAAAAITPVGAQAQSYPSRPISLIVPFAAGGGSDFVSRAVVARLSQRLGQPITVDNRGGASGNIGFAAGARAAPDGHTLTTITSNVVVNPHLFRDVPFDPMRDFAPLSIMTNVPCVILVSTRFPIHTIPELIAYAKSNPGQLSAGTGGVGGQGHLTIEQLARRAEIEITQVPYRGEAPALNDLLAGQLAIAAPGFGGFDVEGHLHAGTVRAIAVTSAERSTLLPDVPTVAETLPGYLLVGWYGMGAPAGTPTAVVQQLSAALRATLHEPDLQNLFIRRGLQVVGNPSEDFAATIRSDYEKYGRLLRDAGIQPQ